MGESRGATDVKDPNCALSVHSNKNYESFLWPLCRLIQGLGGILKDTCNKEPYARFQISHSSGDYDDFCSDPNNSA